MAVSASSTHEPLKIRYQNDRRCQRTEYFDAKFAIDGANGSRWMAAEKVTAPLPYREGQGESLVIDLGSSTTISRSEIAFVRPTAGHAYVLEGSQDGKKWKRCGGHADMQIRSPHTDDINKAYRFLRVTITEGVAGVWEWRVLGTQPQDARIPLPQPNVTWGDWQYPPQTGHFKSQTSNLNSQTFRNPIIPADYSDLDCIRVGDDYYAISSTMQFSPGMTILHSRDLVNWEIAGQAVNDLTQISPAMGWQQMDRYGRGIWAGSLRYHNDRFYLFFGTPDEGYFMTTAEKAEGPWEPLTPLLLEAGWDDCSAIWDKQGQAWFVGTCFREGYKTYLFRMADDGRSIDRSSARLVNEGNGREANKLIYHDGYYYLIFSEHQDGIGRYIMAKRDRKMTGRFLEERQLLLPCREAHEPNQGGIIEAPSLRGRAGGEAQWYFLTHHGDGDWSGRIVSLLPVVWQDEWPIMGDTRGSQPGTMVWQMALPSEECKVNSEKFMLQRSDDFDAPILGPQWQWNYQPREDMYSLTERPGWLRMKAFRPLEEDKLLKAGNTLTQRSFRNRENEVTIRLDISHLADGQHAGLGHFAQHSGCLGVVREAGQTYLELRHNDHAQRLLPINTQYLWLRSTWGLNGQSQFSYSLDGDSFTPLGSYPLSWGYYRGDRIAIYNYNNKEDNGYIDVDYLHYKTD